VYRPANNVRFLTATNLFDGHDAAINIFRRLLQNAGAEVVHLGHNRSAEEVVTAAIEEDVQAVAVTSYQGGHMEFFRYLRDLLVGGGAPHVRIFGGGGGTILPAEGAELVGYGITRIYSPDDGRELGLQGMVDDMLSRADYSAGELDDVSLGELRPGDKRLVGRLISAAENHPDKYEDLFEEIAARAEASSAPVVGITGTGGSGKSSLVDEILRRLLAASDVNVAVISVDPTKRRSGGALLGDRIRINSVFHPRAYMRSLATRQVNLALSPYVARAVQVVKAAGFDLVVLETSGIGQADTEIVDHSDLPVYVMTPEYGAASQLEKIDMLDFARLVAINKADRLGAADALRDVRKQYRRNHQLWDEPDEAIPVVLTVASAWNDPGTEAFCRRLFDEIEEATGLRLESGRQEPTDRQRFLREGIAPPGIAPPGIVPPGIVPPGRSGYVGEVAEAVRSYNRWAAVQADLAESWQHQVALDASASPAAGLDASNRTALERWESTQAEYSAESYGYRVRDRQIETELWHETLSHLRIPKVAFPRMRSWGDRLTWLLQENLPGRFPFTAGVFPFKRTEEEPTRMFAGEGPPEQTNRRFHYLAAGMPAKRLSTAFDSVTLYGSDPDRRPDIYGKVGNSGVSVCTLDDAKKLYSGFDLIDPATSVSMTINGPAPIILSFFLNAAIDQQCEKYLRASGLGKEVDQEIDHQLAGEPRPRYSGPLPPGHEGLGLLLLGVSGDQVVPPETYSRIRADTLRKVRGTVQADILKEDQAQNTCIFSTEFALRMMGDVAQYFIDHQVENFYSVSISGYHMAEAGANPITQLAFTLANAFTYVEYYLARGMAMDDFVPGFSFFFSNGIDPEYAVLGRVARRIWAKAIKHRYGGNDRSQRLKYHVQTSGRSLHAQEISFNDIRTTLQALYAVYDNCNSLHTNAYDEAITTPTEASVRRALAIQLIINRELGLAKNENPLQGSFVIDHLTDAVEQAVLDEFDRISSRGGVLGAMERQYQRSKIQEESLYYEQMKESGEYPLIGVNTFLSAEGSPFIVPDLLVRSGDADKDRQIETLVAFQRRHRAATEPALSALAHEANIGGNVFGALMECSKVASLGQITDTLYEVGGRYRRNM